MKRTKITVSDVALVVSVFCLLFTLFCELALK